MAQWNPYYGVPNQTDSVYEEQNLSPQNFFGIQPVPYSSVNLQSINYDGYYMPSNVYSNFGTNLTGTVFNVHEVEAQQFACYSRNTNGKNSATVPPVNTSNSNTYVNQNVRENSRTSTTSATNVATNSTLTATAAEFKPSTSGSTSSQINSQTFYRNNSKTNDYRNNKGAVRKNKEFSNDFKPKNGSEVQTNEESGRSVNSGQNYDSRYDHRKFYNKINFGQSNTKLNSKQDRNSYNNKGYNNKREEYVNHEVENKRYNEQSYFRPDNRSNRFENRENNYSRNYRRQEFIRDNNELQTESTIRLNNYRQNRDNREGNYNRNYRDYCERNNSERGSFSRDNYNKTSSKNSFRNSRLANKGYENWRASHDQEEKKNEVLSKGKNEKDEIIKNKSFDREKKSYRTDKRTEKLPDDDISQRDRLKDQVNKGTLECLVCCERVRQTDKIWHCQKCYHIFHFRCILKWGNTSKDENGWRCPACQHVCNEIPSSCFCYCAKVNDPPYNPSDTAHSCGDICSRLGIKPGCIHRCNLLCHPGPCPKCEVLISKNCNCGATTQIIKCSADTVLVCKAICDKVLQCGLHNCKKICHGGDCENCTEIMYQECFCGKANKTIPCNKEQKDVKYYSCGQICDKLLSCDNHKCKELCHEGECLPCVRAPDQVKTCPCGKSKLEILRTSCLDPIPCCGKMCGKRYPLCGTSSNPHVCKSECHDGDCPSCPLTSFVRCRCGHMNCELTCAALVSRTDDARCEKKCTKKRSCGRHKCNQLCCIDIDHFCPLPCNHMLTCGLHRCEETCHKGRCKPCWSISFDELYCECGTAVIYPPIPCGTKRPHCTQPCTRQHDCEHEPLHTCHNQPECPPCTVLTAKSCHGGHERRTTIPCHQKEFSCGLPCGKELPCGRHKCQLPCHKGLCLKQGQNCIQSCTVIRENCGHSCGLPCHDPPCLESPCKESVKVTCQCGLRSSSRACIDMAGEYQRIANSMLASKMADMQLGHSIDIADIVGTTTRKQTLKTLECNDECRLVERNRRLAIGLQIRNPDLSAKLTPRYSDFMRQWAKKDSGFCQMVHDKLAELVQLAKQSKQKSRSFSYPSMNREKRQFIHEYCEHFGCESAAYDQEPNRNVVATAARDKAWLPSCSLLELIQRENGQRKVPGPILNRPLGGSKVSDTVSLKVPSKTNASTSASSTSFSSALQQQTKIPETEIDYFNFPSGSK